jgi:hypothetical protein
MITMLEDLKHRVKLMEKREKKILELLSQNDEEENDDDLKAFSTEDLLNIENRLIEDRSFFNRLKKHLRVIGLTCKDSRQHVNSALDALMSTDVQVKVNVVYGNNVQNKQYVDHLSLKYHLPNLLALILNVISTSWNTAEKDLRKYMSDWLKNALKRSKKIDY